LHLEDLELFELARVEDVEIIPVGAESGQVLSGKRRRQQEKSYPGQRFFHHDRVFEGVGLDGVKLSNSMVQLTTSPLTPLLEGEGKKIVCARLQRVPEFF